MSIKGLSISEQDNDFGSYGGYLENRKGKTHAIWKAHQYMM